MATTNATKAAEALETARAFYAANAGIKGFSTTTKAARGCGLRTLKTYTEPKVLPGRFEALLARCLTSAFTNGALTFNLFVTNQAGKHTANLTLLNRKG